MTLASVGEQLVDPLALEAACEDGVLGRVGDALPGERRGRRERREERRHGKTHRVGAGGLRRSDEQDENASDHELPRRDDLALEELLQPCPERARDDVDPDVARDVAEGERGQEARARVAIPTAVRDARAWEALGEPDAEHDQPERREVEDVPVVEAVEAELGARERRRDEQHPGVDGGEGRDESSWRARAVAAAAPET